jgi:hypothetical protein
MSRIYPNVTVTNPQRLLQAKSLRAEEKRELVAHWMSDIHAVPDHPALRRLTDGTVFHIDDLSDALWSIAPTPSRGGTVIAFPRARLASDDNDPSPGAGAMWPSLPPIVIDARAQASTARRATAR